MKAKRKENLIQNGPMLKTTLYLVLPLLGSMLLNSIYVNVDKFFIAGIDRTTDVYVGAVQVVFPFYFFMVGLSGIFKVGINSLCSRAIGRKNYRYINESIKTVFIFAVLISIIIVILCSIYTDTLLRFLGAGERTFIYAKNYIHLIIITIIFLFINNLCSGYLLGYGENKSVMFIDGLGNVVNMVFDPILIYGISIFPRMNLYGAALSTLISNILVSILFLWKINKSDNTILKLFDKFKLKFKGLKETLIIGFSGSINPIVHSITFLILNNFIVRIDERAFGPLSIVSAISNFGLLPCFAMFNSQITIIGQNFGAKKLKRVKKAIIFNPIFIFIVMSGIGGLLFIFAESILKIFSSDPYVLQQGKIFMRIETLTYGFVGLEVVTRSSFSGFGKSVRPIIQILVRYFIFFIPSFFVFLYVLDLGVNSIWYSIAFSNVTGGIFGLIFFGYWYYGNYGKKEEPLSPDLNG